MHPNRQAFRLQFLFGFLACAAMMGYALYAEFVLRLEPCPLCIFQRVATTVLGIVFLLGALSGPKSVGGQRSWGALALLAALAGIAVAGRHLWIQSLPADQVPACGPPLAYMRQVMGFSKMLVKVFTGSGECAQISWRFLGLAMPAWVLICFVLLAIWALYAGFRRRH
ncbi:MAG: disulfide bond formation protein B [Lysobacteraceae bacterium]